MGRWAQSRKRGGCKDGSGFPFLPPEYGTDFVDQVIEGGTVLELAMPDVPLPVPKGALEAQENVDETVFASWGTVTPGNSLFDEGFSSHTKIYYRCRWTTEDGAVLSDWCIPLERTP